MTDYIMLPKGVLDTDPKTLWVYAKLLAKADNCGCVEVKTSKWCKEIGLTHSQLRTALNQLVSANKIASKTTNKNTYITICDTANCSLLSRGQSQTKSQAESQTVTPLPVSYTPSQTLDFQAIVETLRADTSWRESIQRTIGLTEMQIDKALERYPDHCITQGEPRKTLKDAKYHIANWLRRQKYSTPYTQYETKRQDRFSERRGTDPSANRPEDYTATL